MAMYNDNMNKKSVMISVAVPVYNESSGIEIFHKQLTDTLKKIVDDSYEVIYCDDGSTDKSRDIITKLCDKYTKLIVLSRNFGKEYALTAAIKNSCGQAVLLIDADGQHPISAIPEFVASWKDGNEIVIGQRLLKDSESYKKQLQSKLFYYVLNKASSFKINPLDTDYRLLDRVVVDEYLKLNETDRISRGLIDWLGFTKSRVVIGRESRIAGKPSYSTKKLIKLSIDSLVSLSSFPLYILFLIGGLISLIAGLLGIIVFGEQILFKDPLQWKFTGTAMLSILTVFLVGIIILAQGMASLYIATIYNQVKRRPLYIIDKKKSIGIISNDDK